MNLCVLVTMAEDHKLIAQLENTCNCMGVTHFSSGQWWYGLFPILANSKDGISNFKLITHNSTKTKIV
jgi:hypothetical protein